MVQLLTVPMQEIDLKQVVGEHDKDHLIDHQGESARGKAGQIAKALELPIALLDGDPQVVVLLSFFGTDDRLGVD